MLTGRVFLNVLRLFFFVCHDDSKFGLNDLGRFAREVYRPVPEVDPDILKAMKIVGTIGYAPNIGNKKRNVVKYNLKRTSEKV
jgi:hypothetical protein